MTRRLKTLREVMAEGYRVEVVHADGSVTTTQIPGETLECPGCGCTTDIKGPFNNDAGLYWECHACGRHIEEGE